MRIRSVVVHCLSRLSTAATLMTAKVPRRNGVFAQYTLERAKAHHHFDRVVSHSCKCSRLSRASVRTKVTLTAIMWESCTLVRLRGALARRQQTSRLSLELKSWSTKYSSYRMFRQQLSHENIRQLVFPVKGLHHGFLINSQNVTNCDRRLRTPCGASDLQFGSIAQV
jgi:hypothetical protein